MKAPEPRTLNIFAFLMIALTAVLNLVGMYAGLFFEAEGADGWAVAMDSHSVLTHIVLGTLLLVGAVVFLGMGIRSKKDSWIWTSAVGLVAVLAAAMFGANFLSLQNDADTLWMGISATLALLAYAFGLLMSHHVPSKE
jgi:hypothetical protein